MPETLIAYCVRCKTQREMIQPQAAFASNGKPMTRGTCAVCGTNMTKFGATPAHVGLTPPEPAVKAPAPKKAASTKKTAATKKKAAVSKTRTAEGGAPAPNKPASKQRTTASKKSSNRRADSTRPRRSTGKLVIVESPAKAKSVGHFLGAGYTVRASKGHVRDLLVSRLSVDVNNDFEPTYAILRDRKDVVKELRADAAGATEIYLATDPDREGEAIAWHLIAAADVGDKPVKRVVFHEITESAVQDAFAHPREIDMDLINAQQARRILDRLVGYPVSQLLWRKVRRGLSAGRVQSIAVKIIVDREREIRAFTPKEYWSLDARLAKQQGSAEDRRAFLTHLHKIDGKDVEFGSHDTLTAHLAALKTAAYRVTDIKRGERIRRPSAPFITSSLQQEASRRLGFSARKTMQVAQQLYEGIAVPGEGATGLITYMRTDSTAVSTEAQREARDYLRGRFGREFVPERPPIYRTKAKGAQEAHEAIRPTRITREPDALRKSLNNDQYRLYMLIWQRFAASQMSNAVYDTLRVDFTALPVAREPNYTFRSSASKIRFAGFLALYEDTRSDDAADDEELDALPDLDVGETLDLKDLLPEQHFTQPPPRFTEATLVQQLEELGIGRPSTFAPTVAVIQDREYVTRQDRRLVPTPTGITVNDLLVTYFPDILDPQFTARMEAQLDEIAEGRQEWRPMLHEFYGPFKADLERANEAPSLKVVEEIGRDCPECGKPLLIRYSWRGKFIGCSGYPDCKHTEPFTEPTGAACPTCGVEHGGELVGRQSKRGRTFWGCNRWPACEFVSWKKPLAQPCPTCGGLMVEQSRTRARCTQCGETFPLNQVSEAAAETA
ncbi:MAG TPA: type I DNA topoisomerase [Candidatus Limnocylindrales bacterium]|nr:type I DNA topoisomerase [Candidatus Limnocylindrales bacterium]